MFVFLLLNGTCKRTAPFSVDLEKCAPSVGIYKGGKIRLTVLYKVLVLDSILVDCDKKLVCWSCERCDTDDKYSSGSETSLDTNQVLDYFGNKEKLEHEDLQNGPICDELFEKSASIYFRLSSELFERDGNAPAYKTLLEILNDYILPKIELKLKHREAVQQIHKTINRELENIEMLIEMNVQTLTNFEDSLGKQRKNMLTRESISNILKSAPLDGHFIELLLKDIEKDVKKLDGILITLSETVSAVKSSTDEASVKLFSETCAERNKISKEKERIISAKEKLEEGLSDAVLLKRKAKKSSFKLSKPKADTASHVSEEMYEGYTREAIRIETLRNDIKQQINIKIRLSAVRESVISALKYI